MRTQIKNLSYILIAAAFLVVIGCHTDGRTGPAVGNTGSADLGLIVVGEEQRPEASVSDGTADAAMGLEGIEMTEADRQKVYRVLENTPTGETEIWTSDTGVTYHITPIRTLENEGIQCRSLAVRLEKSDGEARELMQSAYKMSEDAQWQLGLQTAEDIQGDGLLYCEQIDQRRVRGFYGDDSDGLERRYEGEFDMEGRYPQSW